MSIFKNFTRVLSQSTLNSGNRTYILNLKNSIHNPALFTLNSIAPPQDVFQLSLASYHLVRKGEIGRNVLKQIEGESAKNATLYADAQERLQKEYEDTQKLAGEYVNELRKALRSGVTNLPVHNAIHALYAIETINGSDVALYEGFLFPIIKEKLQYASLNNLIELAGVLSSGKHFKDTALWNAVLKQLDTKFDKPGPKYVTYSGWSLDTYELEATEERDPHDTESERYWAERKDGSTHYANLRHEIRVAFDRIRGSFLNRVLQRETRIATTLDNFQERLEREKLRKSLEGAKSAGINVDSVIGRLRS